MSEAQHAPEGQVIEGRYRVVSRIADGGMATVYQAVDERLCLLYTSDAADEL